PTHVYPLSLHDALPISGSALAKTALVTGLKGCSKPAALRLFAVLPEQSAAGGAGLAPAGAQVRPFRELRRRRRGPTGETWFPPLDRKSTRLNSSHVKIS